MKKQVCRIIGDIHGRKSDYLNYANQAEYSVQIGDLDFNYDFLKDMDPNKHKFVFGNHDNQDLCHSSPNCLGKFGTVPFIKDSFFLAGGFSIDWSARVPGISWWDKEELSWAELEQAFEEYKRVKPKIMLSHEPPLSLTELLSDGRVAKAWGYPRVIETRTCVTLERMLKEHRPSRWFFAHFHTDFNQIIDGTHFMCLTADGSINCKQRFFDLEI